jgi:hypothetical protein
VAEYSVAERTAHALADGRLELILAKERERTKRVAIFAGYNSAGKRSPPTDDLPIALV